MLFRRYYGDGRIGHRAIWQQVLFTAMLITGEEQRHTSGGAAVKRSDGVARVLGGGVMLFMALSAAAKLWDLPSFAASLRSWSTIPTQFTPAVALVVPLAELAVAACWFLKLWRTRALATAGILVFAFTLFYCYEWAMVRAPSCNCMGILQRFQIGQTLARHLLIRNAILLGVIATVFMMEFVSGRRPAGQWASAAGWRRQRAFTLIEVLVSVAIIAILISLATPQLASTRALARRAVSLNNMRMHTTVFSIYTNDYKDTWPSYTDRTSEWTAIPRLDWPAADVRYFWANALWNYVLADGYYNGDPYLSSFFSPGFPYGYNDPILRRGATTYVYSCTFLADPLFWSPYTRVGPSQWRSTRVDEVAFASKKILLTSDYVAPRPTNHLDSIPIATGSTPWELSFADGSARALLAGAIRPGYVKGDGLWTAPVHQGDSLPGGHTVDGLRGRDVP
jgi:prepilin-type N-terminal cleavage/methylation domain-containing protein